MDTPLQSPEPVVSGTPSASATPSTKVLGIERRLIGFGFALFLILVILAVIYSQYASRDMADPVPMVRPSMKKDAAADAMKGAPATTATPLPATVTPDTVTDDLIDEALSDRDDLDTYTADEMADVEDGSNN